MSSSDRGSFCCQYARVTVWPSGVFRRRPKMALVGLNMTSVTPMVKVAGGGGAAGEGGGTDAGGAAGAALGGGLGPTTTVYPLDSSSRRRKSIRACEAFFSTTAHLIPSNSSNK